jgi:hypothetical protein
MKTLRVLCLHGYHGSAAVLRGQMSPLAAGLESLAEFVYVDAPSLARGDFGWWHARAHYEGWDGTRDYITSLFQREGPFDGVFGFSQGAALTGLLVGLRSIDGNLTSSQPLSFRFAMMVGGFPAVDPDLESLYARKERYEVPSLHIIGLTDSIVESEYSRDLAARFNEPIILEHGGGHVIAATPEIRKRVAKFLAKMLTGPPSRTAHAVREGD